MLTVIVVEPWAGPATASAAAVAAAIASWRMVVLFHARPQPSRRRRSVLLTPSMSLQTSHSRALVAGGTGRVGGAIAQRLEAEGWSVDATGRGAGDLATAAGARQAVAAAADRLGGLELVVHAASDGFRPKPIDEVTEDDWDAAAGATAKGTFFLAQAAAPHLRASRGVLVIVEDVAAYQPW